LPKGFQKKAVSLYTLKGAPSKSGEKNFPEYQNSNPNRVPPGKKSSNHFPELPLIPIAPFEKKLPSKWKPIVAPKNTLGLNKAHWKEEEEMGFWKNFENKGPILKVLETQIQSGLNFWGKNWRRS